jgi:bifunctional DNase/RNase
MKIQLEIVGLSTGHSPGVYSLILGEIEGNRKLPIIIGNFEAQSIAVVIENVHIKRPLTHDLVKSFVDEFGVTIQEVVIFKLEEGIFFSKFICQKDGELTEIESRTSDAVAVAIRVGCPIYVTKVVMDEAGIELKEVEVTEDAPERPSMSTDDILPGSISLEEDLSKYSMPELEKMLEDFISVEDYRGAALIRDEIDRRNK